jgi:hypothetical protein
VEKLRMDVDIVEEFKSGEVHRCPEAEQLSRKRLG